jgi:hypothetical protein
MQHVSRLIISSLLLLSGSSPLLADVRLDIDPAFQETPEWCWITAGQMVFTYYGVANINPAGNFQCGIIALISPACNVDCRYCAQVPAGSLNTIRNMLVQYSSFASSHSNTDARLKAETQTLTMTMADVRNEIDAKRPIIAGISPSGHLPPNGSEHVAVIIGYDDNDNLIVNDPFPFDGHFPENPYVGAGGMKIAGSPGQYKISRDDFEAKLIWRESVHHIRCSGAGCNQGASARIIAPSAPVQTAHNGPTHGATNEGGATPTAARAHPVLPIAPITGPFDDKSRGDDSDLAGWTKQVQLLKHAQFRQEVADIVSAAKSNFADVRSTGTSASDITLGLDVGAHYQHCYLEDTTPISCLFTIFKNDDISNILKDYDSVKSALTAALPRLESD